MANFTATDVKKLRDTTGAGMMDAKKALDEADGDFDAAIDILRTKGAAKAAKRGAEREATAGLVALSGGALVQINCETDFVAKNADFVAVTQRIADAANDAKAGDVESVRAVPLDGKDHVSAPGPTSGSSGSAGATGAACRGPPPSGGPTASRAYASSRLPTLRAVVRWPPR